MKKIIGTAVLAFFSMFSWNVYGAETAPEAAPANASQSAPAEKRYAASVGQDGIQRVSIIGGEYFFDPNHIVVKVDVPVEFSVMKVKGIVPHDIVVKAPDAGIDFKVKLSDDEPKKVKFTPTKTGTYEMVCDEKLLFFKSHKDRGMKGIIEVIP